MPATMTTKPVVTFRYANKVAYRKDFLAWKYDYHNRRVRASGGNPSIFWSGQNEVGAALGNFDSVAIPSGNSLGKSHMLGLVPLWLHDCWDRFGAATTGGTWQQHMKQLWRELGLHMVAGGGYSHLHTGSGLLDGKLANGQKDESRTVYAFSPQNPGGAFGYHDHPFGILIDEAGVVSTDFPELFDVFEARSGYDWRIDSGNPDSPTGRFAQRCKVAAKVIKLSAYDCVADQQANGFQPGLVTQAKIDRALKSFPANSPILTSALKGEFPAEDASAIVRLGWVQAAMAREPVVVRGRYRIACDVGREDLGDPCVIGGGIAHWQLMRYYTGVPLPETARRLFALAQERDPANGCDIIVDVTGMGVGVCDDLDLLVRGTKHRVVRFGFGEASVSGDYPHKPDEAWFDAARKLEAGTCSINATCSEGDYGFQMQGELSSRRQIVGATRPTIESKNSYIWRVPDPAYKHSPNLADCFVMWAWRGEGDPRLDFSGTKIAPVTAQVGGISHYARYNHEPDADEW